MDTLLTHIHHSLSTITPTDITVVSGAVVTGAQYLLNNVLNLKERRFIKVSLSYVVTPVVITGVVALFHAYPDFFSRYPEVALIGQGFYYTVEAIIAAAQKNTPAVAENPLLSSQLTTTPTTSDLEY